MSSNPQRHFTDGETFELEDIPHWQGRPQGKPPWVKSACGRYVSKKITTPHKNKTTCAACKKTWKWKEA